MKLFCKISLQDYRKQKIRNKIVGLIYLMRLNKIFKWLKPVRTFLSRNLVKIFGVILIGEICFLSFSLFFLPVLNLPIFRIRDNLFNINLDYSEDEYHTEQLEITNFVFFPYMELKIVINPGSFVDLFVFNAVQYAEYQETRNQIPTPINFDNITSERVSYSKAIFITFEKVITPLYIVIEPTYSDVEFTLYYELLIFERLNFIISFIIQIILIILSTLVLIKNWKINPWNNFTDFIIKNAKKKFKDTHYTDAVQTVLIQLNDNFKEIYKVKAGEEKDGVDLFHNALSLKNPIVKVADLSTENGKNIQEGTRYLLVGYYTAYRNPSTHKIIKLEKSVSLGVLLGLNDIILKLTKSNVECTCGNDVLFFDFLTNKKCTNCSDKE